MTSSIFKREIIQKGAEATLFLGKWFDYEVIFKERLPKNYRIPQIDKKIRIERTLNEGRALIKVKNYGINVPQVYEIDPGSCTIIMKYIKGEKLKNILNGLKKSMVRAYFRSIGQLIATLHLNGHVHGDITTSNIIVTPQDQLFLIDFGLHEYSDSIEDKSVDIHLLKRVLKSSHGAIYEVSLKAFLEGYRYIFEDFNKQECNSILKNINVIETRGRYIKKEERHV